MDATQQAGLLDGDRQRKTLLMHANILQHHFYLHKHNRSREMNRILLLTPNEGLSLQHLREFEAAGITAELFDKNGGSKSAQSMLPFGNTMRTELPLVEIIEVTRLRDETGEKTVAVDDFEGNNLVLVDEGHRGTSGGEDGAWLKARAKLCEKGFSFEYSATFQQAVTGNTGLTNHYAKNILFNYSTATFMVTGSARITKS